MAHPPYDPYYMSSLHHHHHSPATPPPHNHRYHHLQQHQDTGINTLFVSGLPDDVKAREIHNLFRRKPGFDSCQLKYTGRGNQGVKFDPQNGSVLHIELARSNSRKKHRPGSGAYVVIDKRTKVAANALETSSADGDSDTDEASSRDNTDSGNRGNSVNETSETTAVPEKATFVNEQSEGMAQPCSTLFIANLGPNCTEDELKQALSLYPGFSLLKMRAKGGMPVAFADFEEIEQASKAMEDLQGTMLPSSDRGGMHIEYARSKMRRF